MAEVNLPSYEPPPAYEAWTKERDKIMNERKLLFSPRLIILQGDAKETLGFNIRGGQENGLGIFVSRIRADGLAEGKLKVGDQILNINGTVTSNIVHRDAVKALRLSPKVSLIVRFNPYEFEQTAYSKIRRSNHPKGPVRGNT